jgi:hypothetical protein
MEARKALVDAIVQNVRDVRPCRPWTVSYRAVYAAAARGAVPTLTMMMEVTAGQLPMMPEDLLMVGAAHGHDLRDWCRSVRLPTFTTVPLVVNKSMVPSSNPPHAFCYRPSGER